jgi:Transglycosylase SLT domain
MTIFTAGALATFITQHACCPPSLAPIVIGLAQHESGLDTTRVHHNPNGTDDYGLGQINSANFGWLGLTPQTVMEPCANVLAAAKVFIVRYNGNGTDAQKTIYANSVITKIWARDTADNTKTTSTTEVSGASGAGCAAPSWNVWAQQACRDGTHPDQSSEDRQPTNNGE